MTVMDKKFGIQPAKCFNYPGNQNGMNAVGNFDSDMFGEIIVVRQADPPSFSPRASLIDDDGIVLWTRDLPQINSSSFGVAPVVADLDQDGLAEVGIATQGKFTVLEHDGSIKWSVDTGDQSSAQAGASIFDFEGDGTPEILVHNLESIFVLNGLNGQLIGELPVFSSTSWEYPVVVDVDSDNQAEIIVVSNNDSFSTEERINGVAVFESGSSSWVNTRSIWNQHAYHINNINDDGTIPKTEGKSWLEHNSFRLNAFPNANPLYQADLAIFDLSIAETAGLADLSVLIFNRGKADIVSSSTVQFYSIESGGSNALLGETTAGPLKSGNSD